jgi:hypothetical protein
MKQTIPAILFLFSGLITQAQNLITNGNFEAYTTCPNGVAKLHYCTGWFTPSTNSPFNSGTPDYFNQCNTGNVGVPFNGAGYQMAYDGVAYAGLDIAKSNREYIETSFSSPLIADTVYYFAIYVNSTARCKYFTDALGFYFSATAITGVNNSSPLPYIPQINNTTGYLNDTAGWTLVSGNYTAVGGEQYVIIGNFKSNANTNLIINDSTSVVNTAYIYVDGASIRPLSQVVAAGVQVNATTVNAQCGQCNGTATATPAGGTGPYSFLWSNGDTAQTSGSLCAGPYQVTITDANQSTGTATATVSQTGSPGSATVSATATLMCAGDSSTLCTTGNYSAYQWNTGETTSCIYASQAGNYYVTVTDNNGCTIESNHLAIIVHPLPPVSISVNGDTLNTFGAVGYQWYLNGNEINGANDSIYIANQSGNYSVAVTDTNGCVATSNAIVITGVKEVADDIVRISPNPFTDEISITTNTGSVSIILTDIAGRKVVAVQSSTANYRMSTSTLSRGVYLLQVTVANGQQTVRKMMKQ